MEKRRLGSTDMHVSILGFGGVEIGYAALSSENISHLLNSALDAGLNIIDTAECYGESEERIGKAIRSRRQDFYLLTKCGHATDLPFQDWESGAVEASIERSLRRLQTDYIDLVHIHSCSEEILRQGDLLAALQKVRNSGKVRYIGYSGDHAAALYAVESGAFDTLQTTINIADQDALTRIVPLAKAHDMGIIAKRPLANVVWNMREEDIRNPVQQLSKKRLDQLSYQFLKNGNHEAITTALRFTLSIPGVHTAIVGTARQGRWQENAQSLATGILSSELFEAIRKKWLSVIGPTV